MRPRLAAPAAVLLMLALTAGSCQDPCVGMSETAPPEATTLMEQGYEVSKDVGEDTECELQPTGRWVEDL